MRFLTKNRVDSIRVIHFLEQAHVIVAANIKPSRSRNTLIDTTAFRKTIQSELSHVMKGDLAETQFIADLENTPFPQTGPENRFSSEHYRAIQFTCRQLIKLRNPMGDQLRELKSASRGQVLDPTLQAAIEKIDPKLIQRMIRFFYAFEIQVMDEASHLENEKGRSAHGEYKKAQQQAAMVRVMGELARKKDA